MSDVSFQRALAVSSHPISPIDNILREQGREDGCDLDMSGQA